MSEKRKLKITFLGGAGTVTGSKYLLSFGNKKILVDCGLFQGLKELRLKNWDPFMVDPKTIDAIVLTHAHIDHSGYIPRLIKEGFSGDIHCTRATQDLCNILLPDAGYLQEEEAEFFSRKKLSKHNPPSPLFTQADAVESLDYFVSHEFEKTFSISPGIEVTFYYAGHIFGAASAIIKFGNKTIAFSGDLGRQEDPIFYPPTPLPNADYLVVESTYGNRLHNSTDPMTQLETIINQAFKQNGVVLIPAFAVGRSQLMMYFLAQLKKQGRIPKFPMYVNSPMTTSVTEIFQKYKSLHKLSEKECEATCNVVQYIKSTEESKGLNHRSGPLLIISASGMLTGGRILHHLKSFAPDPNNFILLAGFQAAGTRGRALQDGKKEIKIFQEMIPVRASVHMFENLSAHADYSEILLWLSQSKIKPRKTFITHGEEDSAHAMSEHIHEKFGWSCEVPTHNQTFNL